MATLLVNPHYALHLWKQGLRGVEDYLTNVDGVAVGRHTHRVARRVPLGPFTGYLKCEHRVLWKDRLASWWAGFGWSSKSRREWLVLQRLRACGLGCPEPLAVGERSGQAFLLTRGLPDAVDLPTYLAFRPPPASRRLVLRGIGQAIADL